ncbi:MAG TPA: hypothetical protein DD413_06420, partial [Ruminococcus sp.]|nr:hypothetical protein [Ruminococcus sp.]
YKGILYSLLGRIVIADDLNCATAIAKKYSYRFKIVTLDGQVVNAGGSLTGGSLNRNTGLLSRASEIEELKKQTDKLQQMAKNAEENKLRISQECASFEAELLGIRADISSNQQELARLLAEKRACENELNNSRLMLENSVREIEDCHKRISSLSDSRSQAREQLAELNVRIAKAEEKVNAVTGNRAELTEKREELSMLLQNIRLEIVSSQKDVDVLNSEIVFAQNSGSDNDERKAELKAQIEIINSRINASISKIEKYNSDIEELTAKQSELNSDINKIVQQRSEYEKRTVEIRSFERDKTHERETSGQELARLEE